MTAPVLNIHAVDPSGAISLTAANVPYSNLQWNRSRSAPGTFAALIACPLPVAWPGRYLVTLDGRDEVGVLEKVKAEDDGTPPTLSGRFAESLWARYRLGAGGGTIAGANWRQAATEALCAWHMGDLPSLDLSDGCERATGTGYSIAGAAGASASDLIYQCANGNSAHHLITYDRDASPGSLIVRIVDERDLTTGQSALPWKVFGLQLGSGLLGRLLDGLLGGHRARRRHDGRGRRRDRQRARSELRPFSPVGAERVRGRRVAHRFRGISYHPARYRGREAPGAGP